MKILGIESSCDETAAAIVEDGAKILSNVVVSQIDIHAEYGGVIPEIAARSHIEAINPLIMWHSLSENFYEIIIKKNNHLINAVFPSRQFLMSAIFYNMPAYCEAIVIQIQVWVF